MAIVQLYAAARAAAGSARIDIEGADLGTVVANLKSDYPNLGRVLLQSTYLINGTACNDLSTSISPNDQIDVLPRFAGG